MEKPDSHSLLRRTKKGSWTSGILRNCYRWHFRSSEEEISKQRISVREEKNKQTNKEIKVALSVCASYPQTPVCQPTTALYTSPSTALSTPVLSQKSPQVQYHTVYLNKQVSHRRSFKFRSTSRSEKQMLKMNWKYKATSEIRKCSWNFRKKEKEIPPQTIEIVL